MSLRMLAKADQVYYIPYNQRVTVFFRSTGVSVDSIWLLGRQFLSSIPKIPTTLAPCSSLHLASPAFYHQRHTPHCPVLEMSGPIEERKEQMTKKSGKTRAAFQGELGAFSQQAIGQLLGLRAEPVPYPRFDAAFAALKAGEVDVAVIPLENTLAGSVHENYDLLLKFPFEITAETSVRVIHNLIAPPGVAFRDLRRVYSHPVALNQCLDFFAKHRNIERVPFYDTAGSVKMIMEQRPDGAGAIASELAAAIYKANILKRGIEDDRQNFTRFCLLEDAGAKPRTARANSKNPWKTSLVFSTKNMPGALFRALSALALRDINLTKIESRPLRGKPWEYMFYLDFIGRRDDANVQNALAHLSELSDFLRILGSYRAV
jgi:prephenate dehydratase